VTSTVWLASYPKSGNTWFRILTAGLAIDDDSDIDINDLPAQDGIASARPPFEHWMLLDSGLLTHDEVDCLRPRFFEQRFGSSIGDEPDAEPWVRCVKVHDAYTLTPRGEPLLAGRRAADGAIVIVRDPRDVATSLANHHGCSIDEAIAFMADDDASYSGHQDQQRPQFRQRVLSWSGHVASWLDQTDLPVHLVRYEDLLADTAGALASALAFAGRRAAGPDIQRAVKRASFAELQRQEQEKGFRETPRGMSEAFFRRGEAGAWRRELTPSQVASIEATHGSMMLRLGYELGEVRMSVAG
jgi:hypothetical protein